jgi:hypothetical protein
LGLSPHTTERTRTLIARPSLLFTLLELIDLSRHANPAGGCGVQSPSYARVRNASQVSAATAKTLRFGEVRLVCGRLPACAQQESTRTFTSAAGTQLAPLTCNSLAVSHEQRTPPHDAKATSARSDNVHGRRGDRRTRSRGRVRSSTQRHREPDLASLRRKAISRGHRRASDRTLRRCRGNSAQGRDHCCRRVRTTGVIARRTSGRAFQRPFDSRPGPS